MLSEFWATGLMTRRLCRRGDIGISVNNAVDIAKESADLILLHKDLHVLLTACMREEKHSVMSWIFNDGDKLQFREYDKSRNRINVPAFLAHVTVQILLNNLLYDFSQVLLASDNVDRSYIAKPRKWKVGFIRRFMFVFGPANSIFDL